MVDDGAYRPATRVANHRSLQPGLKLRHADQTLAVYPAPLAPPPHPWPYPMDREAGIAAYKAMISAEEHRQRRAAGLPPEHVYTADKADVPVLHLEVRRAETLTPDITLLRFWRAPTGRTCRPLPPAPIST